MHLILLILVNISYCISDSSRENWYKTLVKDNADDWIDLRYLATSIRSDPLSTILHSYAERKLDFEFPYYGSKLGKFLATAQGFLYMESNLGQALYETKYIAPLMAGFTPTQKPRKPQDVRHFSNSTIYINQWSDMSLESQRDVGVFTFQVQLHIDGVIKFVYKEVPIPIEDINSSHVVKVGISDAYSGPYSQLIPYNTIYPNSTLIGPDTTVTFTPIPTCSSQRTCRGCVGHSAHCVWCASLDRCSTKDGLEQYHALWHQHECPTFAVNTCEGIKTDTTPRRQDLSMSSGPTRVTDPNSVTDHPIIIPPFNETMLNPVPVPDKSEEEEKEENKKPHDSTSMTIITTISITAVCIAAILVISALLILKLRKPVLSPIKLEEIKSCNDQNGSRTFTEQNNSQSYPEYHFVMSEDHDHTVSVVV
ncbi:hypothetical protein ACHWQZ_G007793 [Mnemiopsis leidyi]